MEDVLNTLSPEGKTSMLQDIEAKRPSEVELFFWNSYKARKKHNIQTPMNEWLYERIKNLESSYQ